MEQTIAAPSGPVVVLTIGGSDSSAGAGIQADLKAIAANGGYGASVITALTAQNTVGVQATAITSAGMVREQLRSVFADLPVRAIKTGMLGNQDVVHAVCAELREARPAPIVVDPVVCASSGTRLVDDAGLDAIKRELLPLATLITPNTHEATALTGLKVHTSDQAQEAGRRLLSLGPRAALITGGHLPGKTATDVLVTRNAVRVFEGPWLEAQNTHGTGCTVSSAIATALAFGHALEPAIRMAKAYVAGAIRAGLPLGKGCGPVDPFFFLRREGGVLNAFGSDIWIASAADQEPAVSTVPRLHVLTDEAIQSRFSHRELARLAAEGGADAVQVREKRPRTTRQLIETGAAVANTLANTSARVIIDDRVDVALACGISAVHLGRSDLAPSVARHILGPRALIGGTANNLQDAISVSRQPVDYLGVGPIFGTTTKAQPSPALGVDGLQAIVAAVDKPVIAIGNITADRVADVLGTGAWGVAAISAIVSAADPRAETQRFRDAIETAKT